MSRSYYIYNSARYLIDAPLIILAFFISHRYFPIWEQNDSNSHVLVFNVFSLLSWYIAAQFFRLYTDLKSKKFSEEIVSITSTLFLHIIILTSFLFFFRFNFILSNIFLAFYAGLVFFLILIFKYIFRKYAHHIIYQGKLLKHVLIVGATPSALDFYETINRFHYYGYKCVGFIDDKQRKLNGCYHLGKISALENILLEKNIDEVILALPESEHENLTECIETCDFHATPVRIIPDFDLYATSNIQVNSIGLVPVIGLTSLPQDQLNNQLIKRGFDIFFSLSFFILFGWWVLPLIAMAVKVSSKGPVFFKQERWGINNKKITCYKFRSMVYGSPEEDEQGNFLQATKDDPRITPFGYFLRKTNMDELPQFWNVLKGDMSVVGPRPHPTPLNIESIQKVDRYLQRHLVKPGITGMAQVNGCRGETKAPGSMQRRVNYDLYYIHKWTFWLDCQIILQTIINFVRGDQNAY